MRCFDAVTHNRIANDPAVYPFVAPPPQEQPIDFAPCLALPDKYVLLATGDAATCFERSEGDEWEMHLFTLPSYRGRAAIAAMTDMIRHMFWSEGATAIWGKTRVDNRAALLFHRKIGGISQGLVDDPHYGTMEVFRATRSEWERHVAK